MTGLGKEKVQKDSLLTPFHLNSGHADWNDKLFYRKWLCSFNQSVGIIQLIVCVWQGMCALGWDHFCPVQRAFAIAWIVLVAFTCSFFPERLCASWIWDHSCLSSRKWPSGEPVFHQNGNLDLGLHTNLGIENVDVYSPLCPYKLVCLFFFFRGVCYSAGFPSRERSIASSDSSSHSFKSVLFFHESNIARQHAKAAMFAVFIWLAFIWSFLIDG